MRLLVSDVHICPDGSEIRHSHGRILRSLHSSKDDSRLVESSRACPEYNSQKVKSGLSRACRSLAPAPASPQRPRRPVNLFRSAKQSVTHRRFKCSLRPDTEKKSWACFRKQSDLTKRLWFISCNGVVRTCRCVTYKLWILLISVTSSVIEW